MAKLIEEQIRREAEERKASTQIKNGKPPAPVMQKNAGPEWKRTSRAKIAEAVGMNHNKLHKAKKVVESGNQDLTDAMDAGKISVNRAAKIADAQKSPAEAGPSR